jgi:hypothetical protein
VQVDKRRNRLDCTLNDSLNPHLQAFITALDLEGVECDGCNHSINGDPDSGREFELDRALDVLVAVFHVGVQLGGLQRLDAVAKLRFKEHQETLNPLLWGDVGMRGGLKGIRVATMAVMVVGLGRRIYMMSAGRDARR